MKVVVLIPNVASGRESLTRSGHAKPTSDLVLTDAGGPEGRVQLLLCGRRRLFERDGRGGRADDGSR